MPLEELDQEELDQQALQGELAAFGDDDLTEVEPTEEWTPPSREEWDSRQREVDGIKNALISERSRRQQTAQELSSLRQMQEESNETLRALDDERRRREAEDMAREDAMGIPDAEEDPVGNFRHQILSGVRETFTPMESKLEALERKMAEREEADYHAQEQAQYAATANRITAEFEGASEVEKEAASAWQDHAVQSYMASGMDEETARYNTGLWQLEYMKGAWQRGKSGYTVFPALAGMEDTNGNGQDSGVTPVPSEPSIPRGATPSRAQRQRRLAHEAPPDPPSRGKGPADPADPIAAFAASIPSISDDQFDAGIRRLAQVLKVTTDEIEARIEDQFQDG